MIVAKHKSATELTKYATELVLTYKDAPLPV